MSDLGRWFKLWCTSVHDPDLDNLSVADFGRWAKLGAIVKEQGQEGSIRITAPARAICNALQVPDFGELEQFLLHVPNVRAERENGTVSSETNANVSLIVTFSNWLKYQGDFSTDRVRKFRQKNDKVKRSKRRGEEKRREETRKEPKQASPKEQAPPLECFQLPSWVPKEAWEAFVEMRKKQKAPFTDYAKKCAIKDLERLRASGFLPAEVLDQSTMRGWSGLFEVKSASKAAIHPSPGPKIDKEAEWQSWLTWADAKKDLTELKKAIEVDRQNYPGYPDWVDFRVKEYLKKREEKLL